MPDLLPPFPVDDVTLALVEHALGGAYEVDEDGTHHLVGADMSLSTLLDFLSGYDESKLQATDHPDILVYPDPVYSEHDLIRALIDEVRRLRALVPA